MKKILILGTGFGGLQTYISLRKKLGKRDDVAIHLVNRTNYFLYMPMLHEAAFGAVEHSHIVQAIREFIQHPLDRFFEDNVTQIIPEENRVLTKNGKDFSYDYLVIALGGMQAYQDIPGAETYTQPIRTISDSIKIRNRVIDIFEKYQSGELHFVIVGGGATGVEIAGQIAEFFKTTLKKLYWHIDFQNVHITLIHNKERLVQNFSGKISRAILARLTKMGVRIILAKEVKEARDRSVLLSDNTIIPSHLTFWTVGLASPAPMFLLSHFLNERGFIKILSTLQVENTKNVFALGDIAEFSHEPAMKIPKTAQVAVQEGKHAAKNIFRLLKNKKPLHFHYIHRGGIIPLGDWFAVAEIEKRILIGPFAWWLRRTIFLLHIYKIRDRFQIMIDWTLNIFTPRDTSKME